jgi:peptidoglycan hydrolase-like protein with peptidoglycan-binding domain
MRLCGCSILIITCLTCLSVASGQASTPLHKSIPENLQLSQASVSTDTDTNLVLKANSRGEEVKKLQEQLLELGYYNDKIDGQYGITTQAAVAKFQQARNMLADGVAGSQTRKSIEAAIAEAVAKKGVASPISSPSPSPKGNTQNNNENRGIFWWSLISIGGLGSLGALLYLIRTISSPKSSPDSSPDSSPNSSPESSHKSSPDSSHDSSHEKASKSNIIETNNDAVISYQPEFEMRSNGNLRNGKISNEEASAASSSPSSQLLTTETTSRLAKVNIIDELIQDLRNPDPTLRRKAIWDLGQQADSRAIQPLTDMLIDSDSQQRSLILAALAEIGSRALKPMNRALAISLQDESPQVRQNAIRDLTRIYDTMAQISHMLSHALDDPDSEVQATAKYALTQMNRIRALPAADTSKEDSQKGQEDD